jgi:hypothetical protein
MAVSRNTSTKTCPIATQCTAGYTGTALWAQLCEDSVTSPLRQEHDSSYVTKLGACTDVCTDRTHQEPKAVIRKFYSSLSIIIEYSGPNIK